MAEETHRLQRVHAYSEVPVAPYRWTGDGLVGGPAWPDFGARSWERHIVAALPLDVAPPTLSPSRRLTGRWSWLGPVSADQYRTFSEFTSRMLGARFVHGPTGLIMSALAEERGRVPSFLPDLLTWFGLGERETHVVQEPVVCETLIVSPQGEPLRDVADPEYMMWLTSNQRDQREILDGEEIPLTYLSASGRRGRLAGESAIERCLELSGWHVVRPERLPLLGQLSVIARTGKLLCSRMDSLAICRLLGEVSPQVTVIAGQDSEDRPQEWLRARCCEPDIITRTGFSLFPAESSLPGWPITNTSLTIVDPETLETELDEARLLPEKWSRTAIEDAIIRDVASWIVLREADLQKGGAELAESESAQWRAALEHLPAHSRGLIEQLALLAEQRLGISREILPAEPERREVAKQSPQSSTEWIQAAEQLLRDGDFAGAVRAASEAAARASAIEVTPWLWLSEAQTRSGDVDSARQSALVALSRDPDSVEARQQLTKVLVLLAEVMSETGDFPGAIERLREAAQQAGAPAVVWLRLAGLLADTGDAGGALDATNRAADLIADHDDAQLRLELARGWLRVGATERALSTARVAGDRLDAQRIGTASDPQAVKTHPRTRTDDWITCLSHGKTFADIGALWGTLNERASIASVAGARAVTIVDVVPLENELWAQMTEHLRALGITDYGKVSVDILAPDAPEAIGAVDLIHCSGVIYHLANPALLLERLRSLHPQHIILTSMVIPEQLENELGTVDMDAGALFVPALEGSRKAIVESHFGRLGLEVAGVNTPPPTRWFLPDGRPDSSPWWWLMTPSVLRGMLKAAGYAVLDEYWAWEGRSYTFVASDERAGRRLDAPVCETAL